MRETSWDRAIAGQRQLIIPEDGFAISAASNTKRPIHNIAARAETAAIEIETHYQYAFACL